MELNALDEQGVERRTIMDLSTVIVVMFEVLFFFGGAAWLEMHSRKNKTLDRVRNWGDRQLQQCPPDLPGYWRVKEMEG